MICMLTTSSAACAQRVAENQIIKRMSWRCRRRILIAVKNRECASLTAINFPQNTTAG